MTTNPAPDPTPDDPANPANPAPPNDDPNSEAAKYRRKLREAEAERDQLLERVDAQDRAAIEGMAASKLHNPADLWLVTNPNDLRNEAGEIDADKVTAALAGAVADRPHWAKTQAPPSQRPKANLSGGGDPSESGEPATWAGAFRS